MNRATRNDAGIIMTLREAGHRTRINLLATSHCFAAAVASACKVSPHLYDPLTIVLLLLLLLRLLLLLLLPLPTG